jgi:hypothetical protein
MPRSRTPFNTTAGGSTMTDTTGAPLGGFEERLLGELREIVAQRSAHVHPSKRLRQRTAIASPRRLARWATVSAAVAGAVVFLLLAGTSGSGPASAFAGWSASPTTPGDGELQAAESACQQRNPDLASATPTVTDTRGPDSLLVYSRDGATTTCVTGQVQLGTVALTRSADDSLAASGPITPQSIGLEFAADGQAFREMTGQVGSDVAGVSVVLQGGGSIDATVANGWFAAWWPVSQDFESGQALAQSLSQSVPRSFAVTTASGTTTQPLTLSEIQGAMQSPSVDGAYGATGSSGATGATGATGSSGNATGAPSGIDRALWASFAALHQPLPSPVQLPEGIAGAYTGAAQPPNTYGINPNYAQYIQAANAWILPGSSGICLISYGFDPRFPQVGSGSCNSSAMALSGDMFNRIGQNNVIGLAPDGNTTMTITYTDGSTQHIPVTGNVYRAAGLSGDPTSITLRDASGALTTVPIPATGG